MTRVEAIDLISEYHEVHDDFDSLSDETIFRLAGDIMIRWDEKFEMEVG